MPNAERSANMKRILKFTIFFLSVAFVCVSGFGFAYIAGVDIYERLDPAIILNAEQSTAVLDRNGETISTVHGLENRTWVQVGSLPEHVKMAFVAAEDARFYSHSGVDVKRIFGALYQDIKAGAAVQGASTITQQLIKNSHLTNEKTVSRKIEEALMSLELERRFSKDQILEMYLNYVYFGAGAYGVEAAAQVYFSKEAKALSVAEAATLAAILKSPTHYAPHLKPENTKSRRDTILSLMAQYGFAAQEEMDKAAQAPLELNMHTQSNEFGWYTDAAMEQAADILKIDYDDLISGGYHVYTAMDADIQKLCNTAYENDELFPAAAKDGTQPQSAMVIMDPQTGYVLAMVGGRAYEVQRGLNRAIQLQRQPGSSIKPLIVYAPALNSGLYTAATIVEDAPKTYENPHETYEPRNFGDKYYGQVTLREAVIKSLNNPAVEVLDTIGVQKGKTFVQSVGIPVAESDNGLSLALGGFSTGISPLQLCAGYNALASGGVQHDAVLVTKITDAAGTTIYEADTTGSNVMDSRECFILTDILRDVISVGTGRRLGETMQLAGKTGTNDYEGKGNRDAWMAAYNSEYTAVVWMGYDNTNEEHYLPSDCTGGTYPALVLKDVFEGIYKDKDAPEFVQPDGVDKVKLDKAALLLGQMQLAPEGAAEGSYVEDYLLASQVPTGKDGGQAAGAFRMYEFDVQLNAAMLPTVRFKTSSRLGRYAILRSEQSQPDKQMAVFENETDIEWTDVDAEFGKGYTYFAVELDEHGNQTGQTSEKQFILVSPANMAGAATQTPATTGTAPEPSTTPAATPNPGATKTPTRSKEPVGEVLHF